MVTEALSNEKIIFVANELENFLHHRKHLLQLAQNNGMHSLVLAAPVGEMPVMDFDYRPIKIERFCFHPIQDASLFLRIIYLLLKERPKIIHFINIKPYLYGGLAGKLARVLGWRGRVVVTVPGLGRLYDQLCHLSFTKRLQRRVVEFFLRIAMRDSCVTFETEHDRDFWVSRRLISLSQSTVTFGTGIDLKHFHAQRPEIVPGSKFRVLFAGRFLKSKGLDIFLETAKKMEDPDVEMLVAGVPDRDPDSVSREDLEDEKAGICFLGQVKDMAPLLREVDFVVLPSRYSEGIPRILIEAAACACVPVATKFPGSQALIEQGITGLFLSDIRDPQVQIKELTDFIQFYKDKRDECHVMGLNAVAKVQNKGFSKEQVSSVFSTLYGIG